MVFIPPPPPPAIVRSAMTQQANETTAPAQTQQSSQQQAPHRIVDNRGSGWLPATGYKLTLTRGARHASLKSRSSRRKSRG
jgi:hypothetical protein